MRIGINTLYLIPGEVGGAEFYLRRQLVPMVDHDTRHEFVIFTNAENDAVLRRDLSGRARVRFVPLAFRAARRAVRIIREQTELPVKARHAGVEVLWSPGYTAPLCYGRPQVVSILDMQYRRHPSDLSGPARLATDILVRGGVRGGRRILTISEFSKREIVTLTGARPDVVDVTPLAAGDTFTDGAGAGDAARPASLGVPGDRPYLLCVAHSYPHKNLAALVEAFGRMAAEVPHRLVMVGKPRRGEPALRNAWRAAPEGRCVRVSDASETDLRALYAHADVFVFPSLYEGFGLPVLEAMAVGVPVVTTRMGSIPEVGGDAVVYADPPDAGGLGAGIRNVLGWSAARRAEWVAMGRRRAATFNWRHTAGLTIRSLERSIEMGG